MLKGIEARIEFSLPQTEGQYEAWTRNEYPPLKRQVAQHPNEACTRNEYPHIMWLYDTLKDEFEYDGTWQ